MKHLSPYYNNNTFSGAKIHKDCLEFNNNNSGGSSILEGFEMQWHVNGVEDDKHLEKAALPQEMEIWVQYNDPRKNSLLLPFER